MKFGWKTTDLDKFRKELRALAESQLPYAVASAVNATAYGARKAAIDEMEKAFKNPGKWLKSGILYRKASKEHPLAVIYVAGGDEDADGEGKDDRARILAPHIAGGPREKIGWERQLGRSGFWLTLGSGAPRDSAGRVGSGGWMRIMSAAGLSENVAGYASAQTARSRARNKRALRGVYVVPGYGVFQHQQEFGAATGIKFSGKSVPLLFFAKRRPQYRRRYAFHAAVISSIERNFSGNFARAWRRAISTARPL